MDTVPKTDLVHIYRALKLMKEVIDESPELINESEYDIFIVAWTIVNQKEVKRYDYEDSDTRHRD